jgi:hypothetical protein
MGTNGRSTPTRCKKRKMKLLFDPFPFSLGVWTASGVPGTLDYPTLSNASSWTTGESLWSGSETSHDTYYYWYKKRKKELLVKIPIHHVLIVLEQGNHWP